MKRQLYLAIIISCLLGMFFIPKLAYSTNIEAIPADFNVRVVIPTRVVVPGLILPNRELPFPTVIPGPAIQLPSREVPLVSIPETIQAVNILPHEILQPRKPAKGVFAAAQAAFAAAPGASAPSAQQLNTGFDAGKPATTVRAGAVEIDDMPKPQPRKQQKKNPGSSRAIQVPTWELENEIGI